MTDITKAPKMKFRVTTKEMMKRVFCLRMIIRLQKTPSISNP